MTESATKLSIRLVIIIAVNKYRKWFIIRTGVFNRGTKTLVELNFLYVTRVVILSNDVTIPTFNQYLNFEPKLVRKIKKTSG